MMVPVWFSGLRSSNYAGFGHDEDIWFQTHERHIWGGMLTVRFQPENGEIRHSFTFNVYVENC